MLSIPWRLGPAINAELWQGRRASDSLVSREERSLILLLLAVVQVRSSNAVADGVFLK